MRKRDPDHEQRLDKLINSDPESIKQLISIKDYRHPEYVPSEVLATLVRTQYGKTTGMLDAITAEFHRRIIEGVGIQIWKKSVWRRLEDKNPKIVEETVFYFWEKFLGDKNQICMAELRFGLYLNSRVSDHMKHLMTKKNSMNSIDDWPIEDENGKIAEFIDSVADPDGEPSEVILSRQEKSEVLKAILVKLPQKERNAFLYRALYDYDWTKISKLLKCSIPTARKYYSRSMEALQGALA